MCVCVIMNYIYMLTAKRNLVVIGFVIDLLLKQDYEKPCNYYLNIWFYKYSNIFQLKHIPCPPIKTALTPRCAVI